jgi:hypothetical protein
MYGKVNPTGCTERYGLIQVRLDFFLGKGDARYDDPRFYQVDPTSKEYLLGYTGKLDEFGSPIDLEAYAAWEASLPRIWLPERCFHHHFIYLDPYKLKDEQITSAMALHLPNFYKAWTEEWDKVQGGMRHGWDVATRKPRPTRFNLTQPELYVARRADCLSAVDILKTSEFATQVSETGETFPSTDIDVGEEATNRASWLNIYIHTVVTQSNAANDTGALDTIEVWLYSSASAFWAGSFSFSGAIGTCRDSANLGSVTSGAKRTHTGLDIEVSSGDLLGCKDKTTGGSIEAGTGGYNWQYLGNCIDPDASATFTNRDYSISLYGTGDTGSTAYSETSAVSLGVAAAATKSWGTARTSATSLGVAATATKVAGYLRSPALSLGVAATATRAVTYLRSSAVGLGLASLGAHGTGKAITSAVSLGIAATASRTVAWGRSSSVGLGLAATATRNIVVARVSAVALGLTAAATRGFAFVSAVSLGVTSLGARAKSNVRSAALSLGITVTAVRDLPHLVYTAIGSIYRAYQAIARIFRTYSADASIERTYTADAKVRK